MDPIHGLRKLGQSVWLDHLDDRLIASGELDRMIKDHGLAGLTSNPTILQKAISSSGAYDDLFRSAARTTTDEELFEAIAVHGVRLACDRFISLYERTGGVDGFVSIEVSPEFARDAGRSLWEARRLFHAVSRPNVMVKIPGTREGLSAIEDALAEGINVNITLLFSVERYLEVAERYLRALERRGDARESVNDLASVASFFVSRVDTKVDLLLDGLIRAGGTASERAQALRGRAAIANAKRAFDESKRIFQGARWTRLAQQGAHPQRVLWASTSPKDPAYSDLYYAEALVGHGTIDTMTRETFQAYVAHGAPVARLEVPNHSAARDLEDLAALGVDLERIAHDLESEGIEAFATSFQRALAAIRERRAA
jgi:transaldolase